MGHQGRCGCRYRQTFRHLARDKFSLCADCVADKLPKIRVVLRFEIGEVADRRTRPPSVTTPAIPKWEIRVGGESTPTGAIHSPLGIA